MLLHKTPATGTPLRAGVATAIALLAAATFLGAAASAEQTPQPANPVADWIAANAIRLQTVEAGHGFADMQPLKKVVGNARIVSLGEATHGSREFFQLKHRMLEFLATEMGFTIFSIEANMPEAYMLNEFVLNGVGDPAALIKGMYFWTWDTQEVLDMVLWMREFNKSGKGRVEFTGFDMQTPNVAAGIVRDFVARYDPGYVPTLREASTIVVPQGGQQFGTASGTFPIKAAAGKLVHLSGYIKTENVTGYAGFWWRADKGTSGVAFVNLGTRAPKGTTDWKLYDMEVAVPADATNIYFGPLLSGDGTAWFDGLTIELDGKPYEDASLFDFDFEASELKGFFRSGGGYQSQLDSQTFHSGKQSLRIRHLPAEKLPTPGISWKDVVSHLESSSATYATRGASAPDIAWAIQNGRVVLQSVQMKANEVSRDSSMAANIKWILDRSPAAKIVLWAHNGHVATGGYRGYEPMGASLRKMYGDQMIVFGFAFNQGSFQAMSQSKGLINFTVPPSAGSLDATLAATGVPLFALDLRPGPKTGPIAEWLDAPHKTRTVGALYDEATADRYYSDLAPRQSFDALLFVEKTRAAVKNPAIPNLDPGPGKVAFAVVPAGSLSEYRDPDFGVTFQLPSGWALKKSSRAGSEGTNIELSDPMAAAASITLWYKIQSNPKKQTSEEWLAESSSKIEPMIAHRGIADYHLRPNSKQTRTINGHPAISFVCDYTENGRGLVEYTTFIGGDRIAVFSATVAAAEWDAFRTRFDPIIESLNLH